MNKSATERFIKKNRVLFKVDLFSQNMAIVTAFPTMIATLSTANAVVHSANLECVKFAAISSLAKARDIDVGNVTLSMQFHSVLVLNAVNPLCFVFAPAYYNMMSI